LFEKYPTQINDASHSKYAQKLVAIAFSLWRAAFLSDARGQIDSKVQHAEGFLRKLLTDNMISFAQDREWREWSVNYYIDDARYRLVELGRWWDDKELSNLEPPKDRRNAKRRWDLAHQAFKKAVANFTADLKSGKNKKQLRQRSTKGRK
jgi:hypothetical protein